MKVLFIHQNCPGQYKYLAPKLAADPKNEVVFITRENKPDITGVRKVEYLLHREPADETHQYVRNLESAVLYGQGVARAAQELKQQDFYPDIICAHPGWGEALFIKDIFPRAPLLNYCEYFYNPVGSDMDFDPDRTVTLNDIARVRVKNATQLLSLDACDVGISPTRWQEAQFPKEYSYKISVIHDGIDTQVAIPDPNARVVLPDGPTLHKSDEVVTYVARNLEPYRGFTTFMRAVELLCQRRKKTHVIIVGGDRVSYGRLPADAPNWREKMLREVSIDEDRVHFVGNLPYRQYMRVLQVSSAHVYLTYPFVLSWSALEAMSAGCLLIGSDTPPVHEVIAHGRNGLLVDFFSPVEIVDRIEEVLEHKDRMRDLRINARKTIVERYNLDDCLVRQTRLMTSIVEGHGLRKV